MHAIGEPYTSALCTYGNLHRHAKEERIYFRVVIECMVKNEIYSSRKTISRFAGQSSKMTLIIMNALARPHMYDSYAKWFERPTKLPFWKIQHLHFITIYCFQN